MTNNKLTIDDYSRIFNERETKFIKMVSSKAGGLKSLENKVLILETGIKGFTINSVTQSSIDDLKQ